MRPWRHFHALGVHAVAPLTPAPQGTHGLVLGPEPPPPPPGVGGTKDAEPPLLGGTDVAEEPAGMGGADMRRAGYPSPSQHFRLSGATGGTTGTASPGGA